MLNQKLEIYASDFFYILNFYNNKIDYFCLRFNQIEIINLSPHFSEKKIIEKNG